MSVIRAAPAPPPDSKPDFLVAMSKWRAAVLHNRKKWLEDTRNMFDAEYHDVRFIKDGSGLTMYRNTDEPDFSKWQRWCSLQRSR